MAVQHPDGWIITTGSLGGEDYSDNSPTKTEPEGWVNAPVTTQQAITGEDIVARTITADTLDVKQLSAISSNLGTITAGNLTIDASGFIRGGQTAYETGSGFWLGNDSGTYKFSIGDSTQYFKWDGTNIVLTGNNSNINLGTGAIDAATISIGGENISKLLGSLRGSDNLVLFTANTRISLGLTGSGTVTNAANGFFHRGSGGSGDDECQVDIAVTQVIGDTSPTLQHSIDMSSYFEIGVKVKLTGDAARTGSLVWIGMADIQGSVFDAKADLASVDHLGLFFDRASPNWTTYMKSGDGSSTTETSLGTSYDPASGLDIKIIFDGTTATYYIDGTSVGTLTTTLPNQTNPTYFNVFKTFSESSGTGDVFHTYVQNPYVILTSYSI